MRNAKLTIALALTFAAACAVHPDWTHASTAVEEVCRIRISNKPRGLIQVSVNAGLTYWTVGRVKVAANARIPGFAAASYTPRGTVAATAVHGLRIKTGQAAQGLGKAQQPLMFSVTPADFAVIPNFYGGHRPRSAQIVTDIHSGHSIFRNQAPYVGNPVFIEKDGRLLELPEDYVPTGGEVFVIVVEKPKVLPTDIVFENRAGGTVTLTWPDGRAEKLTTVLRPVRGVGRYDGTTFTGPGFINTNHGGVVTIGTAPICPPGTKEGGAAETRGGFMIQPSYHAREQQETSPQVMVIGPDRPTAPSLEGTPPLFHGYINLWRYPRHPGSSYRVEVRTETDQSWAPPPAIVGRADSALSSITAVRLVFPTHEPTLQAEDLRREAADYLRKHSPAGALKGTVVLEPKRQPRTPAEVYFYIDGLTVSVSNRAPYSYAWDTTKAPNGLHEVVVRTVPGSGEPVIHAREVLILN